MKTEREIQRAHDILLAVLTGECQLNPSLDTLPQLSIAANVLCWALDHNHNQKFHNALQDIEKRATELGYVLQGPHEHN